MNHMFWSCANLTMLNLRSFNTSNVTNMASMFDHCSSLSILDLSSFDTSNVTAMSFMFWHCTSLTTLNISSFDTSNVMNMYAMLNDCTSLTTLDLSSFDTSGVTDLSGMFQYCSGLTICYGRTQEDCNKLNSSQNKPSNVNFVVKPAAWSSLPTTTRDHLTSAGWSFWLLDSKIHKPLFAWLYFI